MLNVHKIIYNSKIYGPKSRTVIWFKDCSIKCKGCINPHLWSFATENLYSVEKLTNLVKSDEVTLLGGEPLDQKDIKEFILSLKKRNIGIVLFTGYSLINREVLTIARLCDIVVSEPFVLSKLNPNLYLRGSSNQKITLFSDRYKDFKLNEKEEYEVIIDNGIKLRGRNRAFIERLFKLK